MWRDLYVARLVETSAQLLQVALGDQPLHVALSDVELAVLAESNSATPCQISTMVVAWTEGRPQLTRTPSGSPRHP